MVTDQWVFWTEEENDRYKLPFSLQPSLTPKRGVSLIVSNRKQKLELFKSFTASLSTFTKAGKNESMKYPWKRIYNITGDLLQVNQACEGPIRKVGTYSSLRSTVKLLPTNLHLTQCIMLMSNCTVTCYLIEHGSIHELKQEVLFTKRKITAIIWFITHEHKCFTHKLIIKIPDNSNTTSAPPALSPPLHSLIELQHSNVNM